MKAGHWILLPSLLASMASFQACGTPPPPHQLLSLTLTPSVVNANGGQVQFLATGIYDTEPFTVTPVLAYWGVTTIPQQLATITTGGLATCKEGAPAGITTVEAWVPTTPAPTCNSIDSAGRPGCDNIGASALLVCP